MAYRFFPALPSFEGEYAPLFSDTLVLERSPVRERTVKTINSIYGHTWLSNIAWSLTAMSVRIAYTEFNVLPGSERFRTRFLGFNVDASSVFEALYLRNGKG